MRLCPNCRIEYDDMQNFCIQCGKKLGAERISVGELDSKLKRMEESIARLGQKPSEVVPSQGFQKGIEEVRLSLLERINHNSDAVERLSERLKEMDGLSKEGKEKVRQEIAAMAREAGRNIDSAAISDLRAENQNIKKDLQAVKDGQRRLQEQLDIIKKGIDQLESNVAKNIYKELTRSLVK